jgi:hypothetical protein
MWLEGHDHSMRVMMTGVVNSHFSQLSLSLSVEEISNQFLASLEWIQLSILREFCMFPLLWKKKAMLKPILLYSRASRLPEFGREFPQKNDLSSVLVKKPRKVVNAKKKK